MRSLVTGAAGFIGSHVVDSLLAMDHEVIVIDDLSGGYESNISDQVAFVQESITDHEVVNQVFADCKPDYVYHCAAYAAVGLSPFIRRYNYMNNLIGSVNLINSAVEHSCSCFVFLSSMSVYGDAKPPMIEGMIPSPVDPYAVAKYAVEMDLKEAHKRWGLPYVIFRPHSVYGERQNTGDAFRNVIGIFMNQCLKDQSLTIFGDGTQERAFTYVGDIARTIARSATLPQTHNDVYNIGGDEVTCIRALAELVQVAMDKRVGLRFLPARDEVMKAYCDHQKVEHAYGRYTRVKLAEGLAKMAEWVKTVGPREAVTPPFQLEVRRDFPECYRDRGLL